MENKEIFVKDIVNICNAELVWGNKNEICKNFSKDTRTINSGDVYIGIKGENFDGNKFYLEALEKGAKVCIIQDIEIELEKVKKYGDVSIIKVKDTIKALQDIAKYKRSLYNIPVIAITGSVGKTSTKDIVASVLETKFKVLKTQGNLNNHIGLPLTILKLENHEALVVEMGMNNLGEIRVLTNIAKPNVAVITNVGTSHIGNLGSRENILKAKLEIIEGLEKNGTLVINKDNDLLKKWYEENKNSKYKVKTYGIKEKCDYRGYNIEANENGSNYKVDINNKTYEIKINVGGEHFVYNSLCAITVAELFEIPMEKIQKGILQFELTKNRMEIKNKNNITIINDTYNANYDSMKAAIDFLGRRKERKIAVLGDMLELGEFSEKLHRDVGKVIVKNDIDILITVGENAKYISDEANKLGMNELNIINCNNNLEAINKIKNIMKKNDVILIKASNGMKFKEIVEAL